jgi:hypothetical protein
VPERVRPDIRLYPPNFVSTVDIWSYSWRTEFSDVATAELAELALTVVAGTINDDNVNSRPNLVAVNVGQTILLVLIWRTTRRYRPCQHVTYLNLCVQPAVVLCSDTPPW